MAFFVNDVFNYGILGFRHAFCAQRIPALTTRRNDMPKRLFQDEQRHFQLDGEVRMQISRKCFAVGIHT